MADNDIYDSKGALGKLQANLKGYLEPPSGMRTTQIKNPANLRHFDRLFVKVAARDCSYIRRLRLAQTLLMVCHAIGKDLEKVDRDDIDALMAWSHTRNKTPVSQACFAKEVRFLWRLLFPERDQHGREDDTILPYPVRHIKTSVDRSRQKLRGDRLTLEEFDSLVAAFADDVRMQALLTLAFESLSRPQELLSRRIGDVELFDQYAKITVSDHGKEGVGILRCIDSYFYLAKWLNEHPLKQDPIAYLFIKTGNRGRHEQLTPSAVGQAIKGRLQVLGIKKPISLYSLKRNGVTYCRLRGDSDVDIQHRARWSSTKQLNTYDLSEQDDTFRLELVRRGILEPEEGQRDLAPRSKTCSYCRSRNGAVEKICGNCGRPLDRVAVEAEVRKQEATAREITVLSEQVESMRLELDHRAKYDEVLAKMVRMPEFMELWERAKAA